MIRRAVPTRGYKVQGLKACPLCGTLTTEDAPECFVCRWAGEFEHDRRVIDVKVKDLVHKCPELSGLLERAPSWTERGLLAVRRVWSRLRARLDIHV